MENKTNMKEVFRRIRQMHNRPTEQADFCNDGLKLLVAMVQERKQQHFKERREETCFTTLSIHSN